MNRNPSRARVAFTLVELLVVIGIIALLISILLPSLNRARRTAQSVACEANLRQIGQMVNIYAGNNKQSLPYGYWDGVGAPDGSDAGSSFNAYLVNPAKPNASDWALLLAASAMGKGGSTSSTQTLDAAGFQNVFTCPNANLDFRSSTASLTTNRRLHYSSHPRLMPQLDDKVAPGAGGTAVLLKPYHVGSIRNSSDIIMIFDASQISQACDGNAFPVATGLDQDGLYRQDTQAGRTWNNLVAANGLNLSPAVYTPNSDWPSGGSSHADIRWRHGKNDTANFLFADGHCDNIRLKKNVNADLRLRNLYVNPK